jgi:hypothetical protein
MEMITMQGGRERDARDADELFEDDPVLVALGQLQNEVDALRAENNGLRRRVERLESRSGRGLEHPSEFPGDITPGPR